MHGRKNKAMHWSDGSYDDDDDSDDNSGSLMHVLNGNRNRSIYMAVNE